jgi:hypothetical protein
MKQTGAASGSWLAENGGADVADSNLLLALVTLAIKTYQASTSFSRQLLVSALSGSVDAEQMVRDDLALVHALALDSAGIQGSGAANQPRGVLNTAGIGAEVGGVNGAAATYANIVNMETTVAVANADVDNMAYLTTPGQRGKLKQIAQLANTANVPVWHDGEMNGYKSEVSTQVPVQPHEGHLGRYLPRDHLRRLEPVDLRRVGNPRADHRSVPLEEAGHDRGHLIPDGRRRDPHSCGIRGDAGRALIGA